MIPHSSVASGLEEGDIVGLVSEDRNLFNPEFRPGRCYDAHDATQKIYINKVEYKLKKIIIWLSIFVVIAGAIGGLLWFRQRNLDDTSAGEILRSAKIGYGDLTITVPASGAIVGNRASDLRFSIPGVVDEVNVKTGDSVTKGQQLASIDSRDLQRAVDIA